MANNGRIQILRGEVTFNPLTSTLVLKDGQLFYSRYNKQLYIGNGSTALKSLKGTQIGLNIESGTDGKVQCNSGLSTSKEPTANNDVIRKVDLDSAKADIKDDMDDLSDKITAVETDVNTFLSAADIGDAAIDTLKELQDYIADHGDKAAQMVSNISTNASNIANIIDGITPVGKATRDGGGNIISTTYAKTLDLTDGTITVKNATYAANATSATTAGSARTATSATTATTATNADKIKDKNNSYNTLATALLSMVYPVGSIYMSTSNTSPSTFLGGTWAPWGSGRVPVGVNTSDTNFSTVEKTGGASTHTLTEAQLPSHTHANTVTNNTVTTAESGAHTHSFTMTLRTGTGDKENEAEAGGADTDTKTSSSIYIPSGGKHTHDITSNVTITNVAAGGGAAHNNLQPYITCYMWKRTA